MTPIEWTTGQTSQCRRNILDKAARGGV